MKNSYFIYAPLYTTILDWFIFLETGVPNLSMIVICLLYSKRFVSNKYFINIVVILIASIIIILVQPFKTQVFIQFVKTFLNLSVTFYYAYLLFETFKKEGSFIFFKINKLILLFVPILGIISYITNQSNFILSRSYSMIIPRIQFPFLEPSYLGIYCGLLLVLQRLTKFKDNTLLTLILLNGILSQSPSFLLIAILQQILWRSKLKNISIFQKTIFATIILTGSYYVYFRVYNIFVYGFDFGGGMERINSTLAAIRLFLDKGFIGLGLGQNSQYFDLYYVDQWKLLSNIKTNGDNFILTLMNELGIIFFLILLFQIKKNIYKRYIWLILLYGSITGLITDPKFSLLIAIGYYLKFYKNNEKNINHSSSVKPSMS